ncbi:hypothetical protein LAC81_34920 (plasmid) [Ensifer adhaerens]|uniref:hypothetical protein n=1 Tax=Ensifer adhaerens TaxID=106592 RepID=UPI001CBEF7AC|nr:hypothetical protein [Ensifer adhaerens]MBZ7927146.1 hypothetical protein [Ensifer adhaerens]UAX98184.1 hypothetical protein LAC78_36220 [Ensifer adhaerens]UAY05566.1 hypothetical protein LAC80_34925 [Ensifer adhaerens]UAY12944.1 hypothetical protein LAC81_34920 [Ensifer adhaerens]
MFPSFLSNRMKEDAKSSGNAEIGFQDLRHLMIGTVVGRAGLESATIRYAPTALLSFEPYLIS